MKKNIILAIIFLIAVFISSHAEALSSAVPGQPFRIARNYDNSFDVSYNDNSFLKNFQDKIKANSRLSVEDFLTIEKEEIVGMTGFTEFIAVPEGKEAVITVTQATFQEYDIDFSSLSKYDHRITAESLVKKISNSAGLFPSKAIEEMEMESCRGLSILPIAISPIQFDYKNNKVKIYDNISFKVKFVAGKSRKLSQSSLATTQETVDRINSVVLNPGDFGDIIIGTKQSQLEGYLIISHPKFYKQIQQLAENKRMAGFNVHCKTCTEWTPDSIMTTIREVATKDSLLTYICFLGNDTDVPSNKIAGAHEEKFDYYSSDYPYGFPSGIIGNFPEIFRGRINVDTPDEAEAVLSKLTDYEYNPVQEAAFYNKGIHLGQWDRYDNYYNKHDKTYWKPTTKDSCRFISTIDYIANCIENTFPSRTVERLYWARKKSNPTLTYNGKDSLPVILQRPNYPWNADSIKFSNQLNTGASYVLYYSHGGIDRTEEPYLTLTSINALSNRNKYPFVALVACSTGFFSSNNGFGGKCVASNFLNNPNGGACGVIGASDETFSNIDDYFAHSIINTILPGAMDYFYNYSKLDVLRKACNSELHTLTMGRILDYALEDLPFSVRYSSNYMDHRRTFHLFGDPALALRLLEPKAVPFFYGKSGSNYTFTPPVGFNGKAFAIDKLNGKIYNLSDLNYKIRTTYADFVDISINGEGILPSQWRLEKSLKPIIISKSTNSDSNTTSKSILFGNAFDPDGDEGNVLIEGGHHKISCSSIKILQNTGIEDCAEIEFIITPNN